MLADKVFQVIPFSIREKIRSSYELMRKGSMCNFHSQFVNAGDLVFDIGANIGDYAHIYSQLGARVVCLEPQPYCAARLRERFEDKSNVIIVEKGVSEKSGEMVLHMDSQNHATATFSEKFKEKGPFSNRNWDRKGNVQVTTLEELIKLYGVPSYCKIDVEGHELSVFKGLKTPIKNIAFEYTLSLLDEAIKCLEYLETLGTPLYNFSPSLRSTNLILSQWTNSKKELLKQIEKTKMGCSGDIFVRFNQS